MTLVMVTPEISFARKVIDRIVFMHYGKIHEVGTPEKISSASRARPNSGSSSFALHGRWRIDIAADIAADCAAGRLRRSCRSTGKPD
jgi:ABC-type glutathione transport system ATPase component